jgi:hypothetical protein
MDSFKKVLEKRVWILKLVTFLSVLCISLISVVSRYYHFNSGETFDFIIGFQSGLFIG